MATDIELLSEKARRKAALAEAGLEKSAFSKAWDLHVFRKIYTLSR